VVTGIVVVFQAATALLHAAPPGSAILSALAGIVAFLLLAGLWTPIAGALLAILASWAAVLHPVDPLSWVLGTLGAAFALLGPGAWSVDARLFGWKRVELPDQKS